MLFIDAATQDRFCGGQIDAIVYTQDFVGRGRNYRDLFAFGHGHRHQIGQVQLALGIFGLHLLQSASQKSRLHHVNAGIDLAHLALRRRAVLVFDDAKDAARRIATQPTIAARIVQRRRQHRQLATLGHRQQLAQTLAPQQRRIAVEDQDLLLLGSLLRRGLGQLGQRGADGIGGATRLGL